MRGGIHDADKARRGVELDLQYIENWSLWFDIRIMARTLFGGMAGRDVF
jgi:putative colanic acid biosynthesis UDP-glucose lipid carrier transferase